MLKKFFILALALMLVLSGCGSENKADLEWDRDLYEHWVNGEEGEKLKTGEHTLDDSNVCSVCGSEISAYGEGNAEIYNYLDEEKNYISRITVYENGEAVLEYSGEYKFDENGELVYAAAYVGDRLAEEYFYPEFTTIYYNEDGSYDKKILNEAEGISTYSSFDAEGTLIYEYHYAPKNAEENYRTKSISFDYEQGVKYVIDYDMNGNPIHHEMYDLEENLLSTLEYQYDENGNPTYQASYKDGKILGEMYFITTENSNGETVNQISKELYYDENGGYYLYEYDEAGNLINEGYYN